MIYQKKITIKSISKKNAVRATHLKIYWLLRKCSVKWSFHFVLFFFTVKTINYCTFPKTYKPYTSTPNMLETAINHSAKYRILLVLRDMKLSHFQFGSSICCGRRHIEPNGWVAVSVPSCLQVKAAGGLSVGEKVISRKMH